MAVIRTSVPMTLAVGPLEIDRVPVTFSGGAATGGYAGYMWLTQQLGACPEASALAGPVGAIPGWSSSAKLSGLAADLWTLKFDTEGKKFPTGVPQRGRVVEGVYVYDPRQDSTYPGGSGQALHRADAVDRHPGLVGVLLAVELAMHDAAAGVCPAHGVGVAALLVDRELGGAAANGSLGFRCER
jgi:hypothetical protein